MEDNKSVASLFQAPAFKRGVITTYVRVGVAARVSLAELLSVGRQGVEESNVIINYELELIDLTAVS